MTVQGHQKPGTPLHPRLHVVATLAAVCTITILVLAYKSLALGGSLALSPAQDTPSLGSPFNVTMKLTSGTTAIQAVRAELRYDPGKIRFESIDNTTGAFPHIDLTKAGNGILAVALSAPDSKGVTGNQVVAVVRFTAIGSGTTAINLGPHAALVRSDDGKNTLTAKTGARYIIADTTAPSVPLNLRIRSRGTAVNTLEWSASADNGAVMGYRVFRNGNEIATTPHTSYTDTGLEVRSNYSYQIAAFDAAGNVSVSSHSVRLNLSQKSANIDDKSGVGVTDLSIQLSNYGRSGSSRPQGDLNHDGVINIIDLSLLLQEFGR